MGKEVHTGASFRELLLGRKLQMASVGFWLTYFPRGAMVIKMGGWGAT